MIRSRNLTSCTYDPALAGDIAQLIANQYGKELQGLQQELRHRAEQRRWSLVFPMPTANDYLAQACSFYASQAAEKGLKSSLLELGLEPPHKHVLNDLMRRLKKIGLETKGLEALSLRSLSRMAIQFCYTMDATPPTELFVPAETDPALTTAREVLNILNALDQQD